MKIKINLKNNNYNNIKINNKIKSLNYSKLLYQIEKLKQSLQLQQKLYNQVDEVDLKLYQQLVQLAYK